VKKPLEMIIRRAKLASAVLGLSQFAIAGWLLLSPPKVSACNEPLTCTMEVVRYGCEAAYDCTCMYQCYFETGYCIDTHVEMHWSQCGGGDCLCVPG
jgi:hypothetical protein